MIYINLNTHGLSKGTTESIIESTSGKLWVLFISGSFMTSFPIEELGYFAMLLDTKCTSQLKPNRSAEVQPVACSGEATAGGRTAEDSMLCKLKDEARRYSP